MPFRLRDTTNVNHVVALLRNKNWLMCLSSTRGFWITRHVRYAHISSFKIQAVHTYCSSRIQHRDCLLLKKIGPRWYRARKATPREVIQQKTNRPRLVQSCSISFTLPNFKICVRCSISELFVKNDSRPFDGSGRISVVEDGIIRTFCVTIKHHIFRDFARQTRRVAQVKATSATPGYPRRACTSGILSCGAKIFVSLRRIGRGDWI